MGAFLWVALGGSLGAVARYGAGELIRSHYSESAWPIATLSVNVLGSLGIGIVFVLLERHCVHEAARLVLLVGFLGAFTTFSTFSIETINLIEQGYVIKAIVNVLASVILCVLAAWVGLLIARQL